MEASTNKNEFITTIIEALHMKQDAFMYNHDHHSPYEVLLYHWLNKLYKKGKSIDYSIQLIYKARNILLLNNTDNLCKGK